LRGARQRHRHSPERAGAALRALLPLDRRDQEGHSGHRARPRDCEGDRRRARWGDRGRQRGGDRHDVPRPPPARPPPPCNSTTRTGGRMTAEFPFIIPRRLRLDSTLLAAELRAVREREDLLETVVEYLRLLLESTQEGIVGIDRQGRCTFVNKAAQ